ncbi:MAG: hypothetical protein JMDDDDMK_00763 [Acidobacteria bacterium]|nr:hypothetical protein [Acidobacteriota bacterium]
MIFGAAAGVRFRLARLQINYPKLVRPGHRHVKFPVVNQSVPRRIERDVFTQARDVESPRLLARAGKRFNRASFQIGAADQMVFGVADVKRVAIKRQALRMIELGFGERAVFRADCAVTDHVLHHAIERSDDDPVVI